MNLNDAQAPPQNAVPAYSPPPPPPPMAPRRERLPSRLPSSDNPETPVRTPPREMRKTPNFNHMVYQKPPTNKKPKQAAVTPPKAFSPGKHKPVAVSPVVSPANSPPDRDQSPRKHQHHHHRHSHEHSKSDSAREVDKKSPAKSPLKQSPSESDVETAKESNSGPLLCTIRLSYCFCFLLWLVNLVFWFLTTMTCLHFWELEFLENRFMESGND